MVFVVPPEIYDRIAMWACTDGGATARSLSLVSRYVSAACTPHKLQSVALSGPHAIQSFFAVARHKQPADRRVQHLFFCDRRFGEAAEGDDANGTAAVLEKTVPTLLSLIARNLRTLAIVLYGAQPGKLLVAAMLFPLPALERLCMRLPDASGPMHDPLPADYAFPCLPRLAHLSFSPGESSPSFSHDGTLRNVFKLPARIANACNALTRVDLWDIEVSGARGGRDAARTLFCLLSHADPPLEGVPPFAWFASAQTRLEMPHLPPGVRSVRVQPLARERREMTQFVGMEGLGQTEIKYLKKMAEAGREGRSVKVVGTTKLRSYAGWKAAWIDAQFDDGFYGKGKRKSL